MTIKRVRLQYNNLIVMHKKLNNNQKRHSDYTKYDDVRNEKNLLALTCYYYLCVKCRC